MANPLDLTPVLESLPYGGIVLIHGPAQSGKTALLQAIVKEAVLPHNAHKVAILDDCAHLHYGVLSSDRAFADSINDVITLTGLEVGLYPLRRLVNRGFVVVVAVESATPGIEVVKRLSRFAVVIIETQKPGEPPRLLKTASGYRTAAAVRTPWPTKKE